MLHQSQLQSQTMTLNIYQIDIFIATHFKKHIFEALCLNFELLANFGFGLLWSGGFKHCLVVQPGLGTQLCYEGPGDLWVEIVEAQ